MLVLLIATAAGAPTTASSTARSCCCSASPSAWRGRWPSHLTNGCLSGTGRIKGYGTYLGADGFIRVLGAALCLVVGVNTAGPFGVAIGIAGLLAVPVALSVQRPELDEGPEGRLPRGVQQRWATCSWPRCSPSPS